MIHGTFVVYGFGGAGPVHGGAFGRELGVQEIIFPLGNIASAFSALGLAVSDLTTVTQLSDLALAPFDPATFGKHFEALEAEAMENLNAESANEGDVTLQRIVELRYKGQVHQVDTPVPPGEVTAKLLDDVLAEFEARYERLFGRGSGFREAGIELVTYRVVGATACAKRQSSASRRRQADATPARTGVEKLYWRELGEEARPVFTAAACDREWRLMDRQSSDLKRPPH